jgi:hypothetical protein
MFISYEESLRVLTEYANIQGYTVDLTYDGISDITWVDNTLNEPSRIRVQQLPSVENMVYLFLHELGHHELRRDWELFEDRFPVIAYAEYMGLVYKKKNYKRRLSYHITCLEEEYLAWEAGFRLGVGLGVSIQQDKWNLLKSRCLRGYLKFYVSII